MNSPQKPCPHCGAALPHPAGPVLCIACGWMPIEEIDRQLAYWNTRRARAVKQLNDEATSPKRNGHNGQL